MKLIAIISTFILSLFSPITKNPPSVNPTQIPTPTVSHTFNLPSPDFLNRVTKKPFGLHVTPKNSPVTPERFTGFHTGADAEYGDSTAAVPINAIAAGIVIYSGYVNGYGGFVAIRHTLNDQTFISLYGHLKPTSLIKNTSKVDRGQGIGILGQAYSPETAGERKHLHFGIIKGDQLDFRGYVPTQSALNLWTNPVDFLQN